MASSRVAFLGDVVLVSSELAHVGFLDLHAGLLNRGLSSTTIWKVPWSFRAEVRGSVVFSTLPWFVVFEALESSLFKILRLCWRIHPKSEG